MRTEKIILSSLLTNEDYCRRVLPYLDEAYFQDSTERILYNQISSFVTEYNTMPPFSALLVEIENIPSLTDDRVTEVTDALKDLRTVETITDKEWLLDTTEKFCQDKAIYNGIMQSIQILDNKDTKLDKAAIPKILQDALGVSFDSSIGHDFIEDAQARFEFYNRVEEKIPFDLSYMNNITRGGLPNKTLNVILASTGAGKSLFMCHCAAANLMDQRNVLYITLEMAEERIAERIDANLLDVPIETLSQLPKATYDKKMQRLADKAKGKLIIKEFPTASAGSAHFRHMLNELRIKKNFVPDVIYVDYLNLAISSRIRAGSGANSYAIVKAIAEELRGLAVEFDLPIITATQTTRAGIGNSDVDLTDTSESIGLPATADMMFALISTEDLAQAGQVMVKQLKNRYSDPERNKRFVLGVDKTRMRLFDAEQSAQNDIMPDTIVMDQTPAGAMDKFKRNTFSEFT